MRTIRADADLLLDRVGGVVERHAVAFHSDRVDHRIGPDAAGHLHERLEAVTSITASNLHCESGNHLAPGDVPDVSLGTLAPRACSGLGTAESNWKRCGMQTGDLKCLYLRELREVCSFEAQIAETFKRLAAEASNPALKAFLNDDLSEARAHGRQVAGLLKAHGADADGYRNDTLQSLLDDAAKWTGSIDDPVQRDAALIASAQWIQHYAIAIYEALVDWAARLGLPDLEALVGILEDEKRADVRLTDLSARVLDVVAAA